MFLETCFMVGSLAHTLPKKRREGSELQFWAASTDKGRLVQLSSGFSLEGNLKSDLEEINGVDLVNIKSTGSAHTVTVTLRELEFLSVREGCCQRT